MVFTKTKLRQRYDMLCFWVSFIWKNYAARISSKNWIAVPESKQSEKYYEK